MRKKEKKKISPFNPVEVCISTDTEDIYYDLLNDENLSKIGISRENIKDVKPVFAIPRYLYEEEGVAGKHNRLVGSACVILDTYTAQRYSIDDIWYFDENVRKSHFDGKEHWNHERRIVDHSKKEAKQLDFTKHVENHVIQASEYIDISLDPGSEGKKVKKRVFRS